MHCLFKIFEELLASCFRIMCHRSKTTTKTIKRIICLNTREHIIDKHIIHESHSRNKFLIASLTFFFYEVQYFKFVVLKNIFLTIPYVHFAYHINYEI